MVQLFQHVFVSLLPVRPVIFSLNLNESVVFSLIKSTLAAALSETG